MHKCSLQLFFATSSVSGLASIVTAIKFNKISTGDEPPPLVKSRGGGVEPLSPPYSMPMKGVPRLYRLRYNHQLSNSIFSNHIVPLDHIISLSVSFDFKMFHVDIKCVQCC